MIESIRRNITAPADWWDAFDAARGDTPLSEWMRDAAARRLDRQARESLSDPRPAHRPPLTTERKSTD